ncbi:MAG TPA: hypothetical protein VHG70_05975 [Nocardioidaceae bacterium]|nr:hypothetical protein [Nocardioidaceae bacterium]
MPTARDLMTPDARCVGVEETLGQVGQKTRDLGVGSLPICGEDEFRSMTCWRPYQSNRSSMMA